MSSLPFTVISVTVDKTILNEYYFNPKDPYTVAFSHIMKSFFSLINDDNVESARILLESRDDNHDFKIQKSFFELFNNGTVHLDVTEKIVLNSVNGKN